MCPGILLSLKPGHVLDFQDSCFPSQGKGTEGMGSLQTAAVPLATNEPGHIRHLPTVPTFPKGAGGSGRRSPA
jgi:hypothetical protein